MTKIVPRSLTIVFFWVVLFVGWLSATSSLNVFMWLLNIKITTRTSVLYEFYAGLLGSIGGVAFFIWLYCVYEPRAKIKRRAARIDKDYESSDEEDAPC